ncbi:MULTISPECIES: GNAT family N-acetyltransferase [Bacillus]|uniref:N-acetyltransferase n=2 Tax=Bacillus cereus group TaxID=86661 RepID=A0A2A7D5G4_BACAN|nr:MULTISPECIES: GNAT family N-acetyltransferase [Bacillus]MCP1165860.1 GNAT family N-acetyltransferase [Bacillus sp. 1813sda1]MDC7975644.1 GNAT family N-acetyltransferase [Bacillus sp. BLCC-B18]OTW68515.1 GNAT family N-acetyltransferase [Bacillus thuringiensis serovar coreanensis]OTX42169.1 GNAT family N-acetyltransferase [Bacillus thuringiensis serovar sooncheon]OTX51394.1 GNAT family N-acetyltransferase [Bacillus thuringiensis serovar guiyangiensis]
MKNVTKASINDLDAILHIDIDVIGNDSRRDYIKETINEGRCVIVKEDNSISGFLTYDTNFFDCTFLSLIIVLPTKRRRGYARSLISYMLSHSPTQKIFSSTNKSNESMQKVFHSSGFIRSGMIENLDEGDPEIIFYTKKLRA